MQKTLRSITSSLINILILGVVVISCNSYDLPKGTPNCIVDKISAFDKDHQCDSSMVLEYSFHNEKYYCFSEPCCCDIGSDWYDADCNLVCISGTIAGTIQCSIPLDSLQFESVIWESN